MGELQDFEDDEENSKIYELEQMKECLCKIENKNGKGVGFFCCIPYQKIELFAMITTNHLVNDDILKNDKKIKIILNNDEEDNNRIIEIDEQRKKYSSIKYDTTIIEINPKTDNIHKFIKVDENIFQQNIVFEKIYIIQYIINKEKINKLKSKGLINKINDYNIKYVCNSSQSFPGCPILNASNDKVIGIHIESLVNFNNNGILLKSPLNSYINDILKTNKKNEINIKIKIEKKDINKEIYILYALTRSFHSVKENGAFSSYGPKDLDIKKNELNNSNTELFINNIKYNYSNCFKAKKEGIYDVKLKFFFKFKDCSDMFCDCENIISIDLSFFDSSDINDTSSMFMNCINLEKIDFSSFDTKNVTNMSNMFYSCNNLKNINLSFFNTKNVKDMNCMFSKCYNLKDLYLSSFDTQNVTNMSNMFSNCQNLVYLDLTSFDTRNVEYMNCMFDKCYNLKDLYLSSFNTQNVTNMSYMFSNCQNLVYLDLSSFDTRNVEDMSYMFDKCYSLIFVNISSFIIYNEYSLNNIFNNCYNLTNIDLSCFHTKNINKRNKNNFNNCINLLI